MPIADIEPNDQCGDSATTWPEGKIAGISTGSLGEGRGAHSAYDPGDWSKVLVYKTEIFTVTLEGPSKATIYDPTCTLLSSLGQAEATTTGYHYIFIPHELGAGAFSYTLKYVIKANDARMDDAGPNAASAYPVPLKQEDNPLPIYTEGAVPIRGTQFDRDWYEVRADTSQQQGGLRLGGILSVVLAAECTPLTSYTLTLFQTDGLTSMASEQRACGELRTSCIAIGPTALYAEAAAVDGTGGGYRIWSSLQPLDAFNIEPSKAVSAAGQATNGNVAGATKDGWQVVRPSSVSTGGLPWCSAAAPVLLSFAGLLPDNPPPIPDGDSLGAELEKIGARVRAQAGGLIDETVGRVLP